MENRPTYHIIGAGVAGLYTAKLLKDYSPNAYIIIYESTEKVGGRCKSSFSEELGCQTDNATHVILSCNRFARALIGKKSFPHLIHFFDLRKNKLIPTFCARKEIYLSVFNSLHPSLWQKLYMYVKLFPFWGLKAYFSCGNLENTLCRPLLRYCDEIRYGWVWKDIKAADSCIYQLIFNKGIINISPTDKIISAIDSFNYNKIMGGYDFNYNAISNIFYRTSMPLTLPQNNKMLGICNGKSQWIFSAPQYSAITISNSGSITIDPREIWQELCSVRNYNSAFLPSYQVRHFPRATINQDRYNNTKRPNSAKTKFRNLYICGDWTMKNRPCCIETALQSAVRVCHVLKR